MTQTPHEDGPCSLVPIGIMSSRVTDQCVFWKGEAIKSPDD